MDLAEIRERLEKASGPDREIDALIALAWQEPNEHYKQPLRHPILLAREHQRPGLLERVEISGVSAYVAPKYTESLDAIVSLIERKLPGWKRTLTIDDDYCTAHVIPNGDDNYGVADPRTGFAHAPTAPLALCLAFVKAMEAQSKTEQAD